MTAGQPSGAGRFASWLVASAMLLALLGQSILLGAHVHVASFRGFAQARATPGATALPTPARPDDPAACPLCRELARAGSYLPAAPPAWSPPSPAEPWWFACVPLVGIAHRRMRGWRSRGPPGRAAA